MFKILAPFFSRNKTSVTNTDNTANNVAVSIWKDTGKVYYLENTLKLSYDSELGKVTYEDLNLEKLSQLLVELDNTDRKGSNQKTVANVKDALTISICAVTWQQKDGSTRIKAIPNAAMLRSKTSDFKQSQAVFRHEHQLEHDDILATTNVNGKNGVFTYSGVSVKQFVNQIENINQALTDEYRKQISVKQDNFKQAFTDNEEQAIHTLLDFSENKNSVIEHNNHK